MIIAGCEPIVSELVFSILIICLDMLYGCIGSFYALLLLRANM